jgi:alpha-beta hydrolase superfamily lysophospholipase
VLLAGGGTVLLAAAAAFVLSVAMARTVVTPPRKRKEDTPILDVDLRHSTITLGPTADAILPGNYSFWFDSGAGLATLGEIVRRTHDSVTRRILRVERADLRRARTGRFNGWIYLSPGELGYEFEDVVIDTPVGPAPAWLIPSATGSDRWAIHVHGRAVARAETLRGVPVFRDAGYNSLVVSYRNDGEAPASPDGKYSLGDTEWLDVQAALAYAIDRGATSVVLVGWSMGGATALQLATRSSLARVIRGIVLESPVVDWSIALDFQAKLSRLPKPIGAAAKVIMGRAWGRVLTGQHEPIDLERLDLVRGAAALTTPILILHSDDDGYVPSTASHALAEARPDIVTMETFAGARHTKLWNYDPERWNAAIASWLERLNAE